MPVALIKKEPSKALVVAAFAAIYIIWGSTYLGILFAIKTIPPFFMAGVRFSIVGLLLLGWCLLKKEKMPSMASVLKIALSGILMLLLGNGSVTWVEQYLPSSLAAIVVATMPLWLVLLDKRNWGFYFSNKMIIIGLVTGFAGVVLLIADGSAANFFQDKRKSISLLILLAGTISWTIGSLYSKYKQMEGSTLMKVSIQMLAAGMASLLAGVVANEQKGFALAQVSHSSVMAMLYLIFIGSLVGYVSFMWLLSVRPASLVGTYAYVNPVVAVFLGWAIAGETITQQQMIGLGVIILGLMLVNLYKEKHLRENTLIDTGSHKHKPFLSKSVQQKNEN